MSFKQTSLTVDQDKLSFKLKGKQTWNLHIGCEVSKESCLDVPVFMAEQNVCWLSLEIIIH